MENLRLITLTLFIGLIVGATIAGGIDYYLYQDNKVVLEKQLDTEISNNLVLQEQVNQVNLECSTAIQDKAYSDKQVLTQRQQLTELQGVYSDLFTDAAACYYANYCLYYPTACLELLGDVWVGYTVEEIQVAESDYCDGMSRDWEKYQSFDETLK